ncbi:MAG: crotonase/enoyl-CoA hydratase family protein [Leptospira sp.]|nr:crotonase/enoyl-CoA hydratase family protein [Leptospira sp.]
MELIQLERMGKILKIGLNRPERNNAFSIKMLLELSEAYTFFENETDLYVAVLYSKGKHFTVGLEIEEVSAYLAQSGGIRYPDNWVDPFGLVGRTRKKPLIMAIQGFCFTHGIELALASDIRLSTKSARFTQAEVQRGFAPIGGATFRMGEQFGWGNAMRYLLTGDVFNGEEAYRIGLVQELVEPDDLMARSLKIADTIANNAQGAIREILVSSNSLRHHETKEFARLESNVIAQMLSQDGKEGILSFHEKRKANFT